MKPLVKRFGFSLAFLSSPLLTWAQNMAPKNVETFIKVEAPSYLQIRSLKVRQESQKEFFQSLPINGLWYSPHLEIPTEQYVRLWFEIDVASQNSTEFFPFAPIKFEQTLKSARSFYLKPETPQLFILISLFKSKNPKQFVDAEVQEMQEIVTLQKSRQTQFAQPLREFYPNSPSKKEADLSTTPPRESSPSRQSLDFRAYTASQSNPRAKAGDQSSYPGPDVSPGLSVSTAVARNHHGRPLAAEGWLQLEKHKKMKTDYLLSLSWSRADSLEKILNPHASVNVQAQQEQGPRRTESDSLEKIQKLGIDLSLKAPPKLFPAIHYSVFQQKTSQRAYDLIHQDLSFFWNSPGLSRSKSALYFGWQKDSSHTGALDPTSYQIRLGHRMESLAESPSAYFMDWGFAEKKIREQNRALYPYLELGVEKKETSELNLSDTQIRSYKWALGFQPTRSWASAQSLCAHTEWESELQFQKFFLSLGQNLKHEKSFSPGQSQSVISIESQLTPAWAIHSKSQIYLKNKFSQYWRSGGPENAERWGAQQSHRDFYFELGLTYAL